jgi:hypothetical protein
LTHAGLLGKTGKWGNNERDSAELISNEAQKENRLQTMNRSFRIGGCGVEGWGSH